MGTPGPDKPAALASMRDRVHAAYRDFAKTTTCGGVVHTFVAPNWPVSGLWLLVIAGMIAATVWNTNQIVQDYLSYPVTTTASDTYEGSVEFPEVTVCNRNPVPCMRLAKSYMKHSADMTSLVSLLFETSRCREQLVRRPLIDRLIKLGETEDYVDDFLSLKVGNLLTAAIHDGAWEFVLGYESNGSSCRQELNISKDTDFEFSWDTTFKILGENCLADLGRLLFPSSWETDVRSLLNFNFTGYTFSAAREKVKQDLLTASATVRGLNGSDPNVTRGDEVDGEDMDFGNPVEDVTASEEFVLLFMLIYGVVRDAALTNELVETFDDFILSCTYNGVSCKDFDKYFTLDILPDYGACYHFNAAKNNLSLKALEAGSVAGLSVEINLDQVNYMPLWLAGGAGARVMITHPSSGQATPYTDGYNVKPHSEADFVLKQKRVVRQPAPFPSKCYSDWSAFPFMPVKLEFNATSITVSNETQPYAYTACHRMCSSWKMMTECGCLDLRTFFDFDFKEGGVAAMNASKMREKQEACKSNNLVQRKCRTRMLQKMQNSEEDRCGCRPPCQDFKYVLTTSISEWPSDSYLTQVWEKYAGVLGINYGEGDNEQAAALIAKDLARINIYFQTLNVEAIEEAPKYDFFQLLTALGGGLSLYLGLCGITVFELAEFLIMVILAVLGVAHKRGLEKDKSKQQGLMKRDNYDDLLSRPQPRAAAKTGPQAGVEGGTEKEKKILAWTTGDPPGIGSGPYASELRGQLWSTRD